MLLHGKHYLFIIITWAKDPAQRHTDEVDCVDTVVCLTVSSLLVQLMPLPM